MGSDEEVELYLGEITAGNDELAGVVEKKRTELQAAMTAVERLIQKTFLAG